MDATPISQTFAALLKQYRMAVGLTQEELAERAQLSIRAVSDLERGVKSRPYPATIRLLANALQLTATERAELEVAAGRRNSTASTPPSALPPPAPRHNLPRQTESFIGREQEQREVLALLDEAGSPATVATAGPRYFGFVNGGTLPVATAAAWLTAPWMGLLRR